VVATTTRSAAVHEYTLFTADASSVPRALAECVADVVEIRDASAPAGRVARLAALPRQQRRLGGEIDAMGADLLVVHPSRVTQAPLLLTAVRRTPSVYVAHETRRRTHERGYQPWIDPGGPVARHARRLARVPVERVLGHWDRRATAAATALVVNSEWTAAAMARAYGRTGTVVHPGVDVDLFTVGSGQRSGVLSVGAIDPTKGHDLVVDALARIDAPRRPSLTIVHERVDPTFAARLAAQASRTGVTLTLRRDVDDKELADLYGSARVVVAAGRHEPFGLTPLEAMATGTPVVAVADGGYTETVRPGVNGVLVPRDAGALADAMRAVMAAAPADPWAIRESVVPYWTWDRAVDELHAVFRTTAARR
jgi:glycosyltransferase involved in cell wall biosynthesis